MNFPTEEQWEKDLEAELKDYEVVSGSITSSSTIIGSSRSASKGKGSSKKKKSANKNKRVEPEEDGNDDDELPTISNLRTRSTNNDWEEEYADLIEDTDDLK